MYLPGKLVDAGCHHAEKTYFHPFTETDHRIAGIGWFQTDTARTLPEIFYRKFTVDTGDHDRTILRVK